MPIKEQLAKVKTKAGSTHDGNGGDVAIPNADQDLENNMFADTLIDPEDMTGGSTHSMTASKKRVKADADCIQQNVGTLPNDSEPAKGYLENASEEDFEVDDDEMDEDEVAAGLDPALTNNNSSTPLEADAEDADWDAPISNAEDDIEEGEGAIADDAQVEVEEPEEMASGDEEMSLMDIDEVPDEDTNVAFATLGTRVMVIRANRIIATMTAKTAASLGRDDVYLTDQFQEVTAMEIGKQGLRKGLRSMGFIEAKVNVAKRKAVNARVALLVTKQTAAVRKVAQVNAAAMEQAMAIAAVGINRKFFQGAKNELRDALEAAMVQAGVRNAGRILTTAFAEAGPAYAKQICELATKLSMMPKETRAGFVAALDMTSGDMEDDADTIPVGEESMDGTEEDDVMPATMATAGVTLRKTGNTVRSGMLSVEASARLAGDLPMFIR
jgi:hypothetical protein